MSKVPTPCISVCKFKREGHCIGCSMTKDQKAISKKLKKNKQRLAFLELVIAQQEVMGRYKHWTAAFAKRAAKKKFKLSLIEGNKAA